MPLDLNDLLGFGQSLDGPNNPGTLVPPNPDDDPELGRRKWSLDRCGNFVAAAGVRPAAKYPCTAPYPCGSFAFQPGFSELISIDKMRGVDEMGVAGLENEELCGYHTGKVTVDAQGWTRPITCTQPELGGDCFHAIGGFAVLADGFTHALAGVESPDWFEAAIVGRWERCPPPI